MSAPGDPSAFDVSGYRPSAYPPGPHRETYIGHPMAYIPPGMADPGAPFGRHPVTGVPLSDKSKATAGLLQFFLGGVGAGRFYIGDNRTAFIQAGLNLGGCTLVILCSLLAFLIVPIIGVLVGGFMWLAGGIWVLIDALVLFSGNARDSQGRPLRS